MDGKPMTRRRLTIRDMILMVVAAALALAGFRFAITGIFEGWLDYSRWPSWIARPTPRFVLYMLSDATAPLIPLAAAWTGVLLVLRRLPPRSSWRRAARQPGVAACLAALTALLWVGLATGLMFGILACFPTRPADPVGIAQGLVIGHVFPLVGLAVAATWCQMILSGRWARPADWIDRAGRAVGLLWILIGLAWTLRSYELIL